MMQTAGTVFGLDATPVGFRAAPIIDLAAEARSGTVVETSRRFEDSCVFRAVADAGDLDPPMRAAAWLRASIEAAGDLLSDAPGEARPISVALPIAIFADPDAAMAADCGARARSASPQEFRLEVLDSALSADPVAGFRTLDALAGRGFRLCLDARLSWRTAMSARARGLFESVRVDGGLLDVEAVGEVLAQRIEAARGAGVRVIADGTLRRESAALLALGVDDAVAPRADA